MLKEITFRLGGGKTTTMLINPNEVYVWYNPYTGMDNLERLDNGEEE